MKPISKLISILYSIADAIREKKNSGEGESDKEIEDKLTLEDIDRLYDILRIKKLDDNYELLDPYDCFYLEVKGKLHLLNPGFVDYDGYAYAVYEDYQGSYNKGDYISEVNLKNKDVFGTKEEFKIFKKFLNTVSNNTFYINSYAYNINVFSEVVNNETLQYAELMTNICTIVQQYYIENVAYGGLGVYLPDEETYNEEDLFLNVKFYELV